MSTETFTSGEMAAVEKDLSTPAESSPAPHPQPTEPASPDTKDQVRPTEQTPAGIPYTEHARILDGFYDKLKKVAWAESLDPAEVHEAIALAKRQRQEHSRSQAPTPDARDERGEPFYSPQQAAALARYEARLAVAEATATFEERFGPIEGHFESVQRMDSIAAQIDRAAHLPGFTDHLDAITALIQDGNQRRARGERVPRLTVEQAYLQIVVPKLAASREELAKEERKKVLEEMNHTSADVRREVNPNRGAPASRQKDADRPWGDIIDEKMRAARSKSA